MAYLVDQEDIEGWITRLTAAGIVGDMSKVDRGDYEYFTDQLLGGESMTRRYHIDDGDIASLLGAVEDAQAP